MKHPVKPEAEFLAEVAAHEMKVLRDDGLYRHLRFSRPNSWCMGFDLLTWPGNLCITGDMGSYVFARLPDMFQFFRGDGWGIDHRYWAEKVQAADKSDGVQRFSAEQFEVDIRGYFDDIAKDHKWPAKRRLAEWEVVHDAVIRGANDGEYRALADLQDFETDDYDFRGIEGFPGREWSPRFVWCCYAIRWGIAKYDAAKATGEQAA